MFDIALIIKYFHLKMTHGIFVYILGVQIQLCDNVLLKEIEKYNFPMCQERENLEYFKQT